MIASTMWVGVSFLPDDTLRGSTCPEARIFILVPPISTTRIFEGLADSTGDAGSVGSWASLGRVAAAAIETPRARCCKAPIHHRDRYLIYCKWWAISRSFS